MTDAVPAVFSPSDRIIDCAAEQTLLISFKMNLLEPGF